MAIHAHIHLVGPGLQLSVVVKRVEAVFAPLDVLLAVLLELGDRVVLNGVGPTVRLLLLLGFITSAKAWNVTLIHPRIAANSNIHFVWRQFSILVSSSTCGLTQLLLNQRFARGDVVRGHGAALQVAVQAGDVILNHSSVLFLKFVRQFAVHI